MGCRLRRGPPAAAWAPLRHLGSLQEERHKDRHAGGREALTAEAEGARWVPQPPGARGGAWHRPPPPLPPPRTRPPTPRRPLWSVSRQPEANAGLCPHAAVGQFRSPGTPRAVRSASRFGAPFPPCSPLPHGFPDGGLLARVRPGGRLLSLGGRMLGTHNGSLSRCRTRAGYVDAALRRFLNVLNRIF